MRKILVTVIICIGVVLLFSVTAKTQSPVSTQSPLIGTWKTIDDEGPNKGKESSYIEIFEKMAYIPAKLSNS